MKSGEPARPDPSRPDPAAWFGEVAATHPRCFWLDGGGARHWSGRRSLLGVLEEDDVSLSYDAAARVVTRHVAGRSEVVGDDVFTVLEEELAAGSPSDQWFGYLGYACRPDLPAAVVPTGTPGRVPDAVWMRPRRVRMYDHPEVARGAAGVPGVSRLAPLAPRPADAAAALAPRPADVAAALAPRPADVAAALAPRPADAVPGEYAAAFARVQEQLRAGNTYEVNLTYRLVREADLDPAAAYLRLRELNPAPYAGFLQHDVPGHRAWLLSSSPERYALVTADRHLETRPIKGTTPRGSTPAEDARLRELLRTDPKFRSENLMVLDLLRNDVSMVCEPGTVVVPRLMEVESYRSVHQLVSTVRGRLRGGVSTVQALRALFPAGSMTGAPKLRTMSVIEEVESSPRGVYAGAFGWLAADGRADLGVVIRSLVTGGDGRWQLGTGGGVTVRSDPAEEWAESSWKADRLLRVLDAPDR